MSFIGNLIGGGRFLIAWNRFGLDLRRIVMDLRDMGDKQGGRSWWGIILLGTYGVLELVDKHFAGFLPPAATGILTDAIGLFGGILTAAGVTRKIGKVAANGGAKPGA